MLGRLQHGNTTMKIGNFSLEILVGKLNNHYLLKIR